MIIKTCFDSAPAFYIDINSNIAKIYLYDWVSQPEMFHLVAELNFELWYPGDYIIDDSYVTNLKMEDNKLEQIEDAAALFKIDDRRYIYISYRIELFTLKDDEEFIRFVSGPYSPNIITTKRYYDFWRERSFENIDESYPLDKYYLKVDNSKQTIYEPFVIFFWNNGSNYGKEEISYRRIIDNIPIVYYEFKPNKIPKSLENGSNFYNKFFNLDAKQNPEDF